MSNIAVLMVMDHRSRVTRFCAMGGRAIVGALIAAGVSAAAAPDPAADQLARALQRKYDTIKDFSADFVHTYQGGVLNTRFTERGHVLIKKPGRMRWEYAAPEQKLFVSDGVRIYSYLPQDKQVIVSRVPQGDEAPTPLLFLAGRGNLLRDFDPSVVDLPPGLP